MNAPSIKFHHTFPLSKYCALRLVVFVVFPSAGHYILMLLIVGDVVVNDVVILLYRNTLILL